MRNNVNNFSRILHELRIQHALCNKLQLDLSELKLYMVIVKFGNIYFKKPDHLKLSKTIGTK